MSKITLVNLRSGKRPAKNGFYCDRRSPVGNPFTGDRDTVCDKYETYFHRQMESNGHYREYLLKMREAMISGNGIELFCWCVPLRCHTETIRAWLEIEYKEFLEYTYKD